MPAPLNGFVGLGLHFIVAVEIFTRRLAFDILISVYFEWLYWPFIALVLFSDMMQPRGAELAASVAHLAGHVCTWSLPWKSPRDACALTILNVFSCPGPANMVPLRMVSSDATTMAKNTTPKERFPSFISRGPFSHFHDMSCWCSCMHDSATFAYSASDARTKV